MTNTAAQLDCGMPRDSPCEARWRSSPIAARPLWHRRCLNEKTAAVQPSIQPLVRRAAASSPVPDDRGGMNNHLTDFMNRLLRARTEQQRLAALYDLPAVSMVRIK